MIENVKNIDLLFYCLLLIPVTAFIIAKTSISGRLRFVLNLLLAGILVAFLLTVLLNFPNYSGQSFSFFSLLSTVQIALYIDPLSLTFGLIIAVLWFVTIFYSYFYNGLNRIKNLDNFDAYFALSIFATLGLAFAKNLMTAFVFYELLTLFSLPLVLHLRNNESLKAGKSYLLFLTLSSFALLAAIILTQLMAGNLDFKTNGIFSPEASKTTLVFLLILFVFGTAKAALFPLHSWLVRAMAAPVPVSALLHAVAVVKAGAFLMIRVINDIIGVDLLYSAYSETYLLKFLVAAVCFSSLYASAQCLRQKKIKNLLAFSTIVNLSNIVLLAMVFTPAAIIAACFQLVAHSLTKITLFFSYGSFRFVSGKSKIGELEGLYYKAPKTAIIFLIGCAAMIGLPPSLMFLTKFLGIATSTGAQNYFIIATLALSNFISAIYYSKIAFKLFLPVANKTVCKAENIFLLLPSVICLALLIFLFVYSSSFINFILQIYV